MEGTSVMRLLVVLALCCLLLASPSAARPPHRQKRVSDQRLAELETLLALAKMNNRKYVTLPVGFGLVDVNQIGRRKRSASVVMDGGRREYDVNDLLADLTTRMAMEEAAGGVEEGGAGSEDAPNYPSSALTTLLQQEEMEEGERRASLRGGELQQGRIRPQRPSVFLGLDGVPRRRFI